jgi:hypothetical protein
MERYICSVINKKICPYKDVDSFYADERCTPCTIPEVYMGIRPNVPESHCEAGSRNVGYEKPEPSVSTELDRLYYYMTNHSKVFQNMGMDQKGELMDELKKVLDKYDIV